MDTHTYIRYASKNCSKNGPFRLLARRQRFPKNGVSVPFHSMVRSVPFRSVARSVPFHIFAESSRCLM